MTAMGQFSMSQTPTGTSMTATHLIGNINNVATEANTVNLVYGNRVKQIAQNPESIKARLRESVDRANRKK
jgi:2-polyprenyl-6-methoxyphenol hydroxylase-like FAD-dependent oxidoreductase